MKSKKLWLGLLVMMLALGMTVVGCDDSSPNSNSNGSSNTNYFDTLNLITTDPSPSLLSANGLTLVQFNSIKNASGGGFLGWTESEYGGVFMAWAGRSIDNFNSVADIFAGLFNQDYRDTVPREWGLLSSSGEENDYFYELVFHSKEYSANSEYLPAGSMWATISH